VIAPQTLTHHGDGTQAIFYARSDIFYGSVHTDPSAYFPHFARYADETGTGPGEGANLNLPLPFGADDAAFIAANTKLCDTARPHGAEALILSAGWDAHCDDPISLGIGSAQWIYDSLYCARGQAENLIKLHKTQLASDRTSCRSALANQVRLVFHTAAYWLLLTIRDAIPKIRDLATAEFATLRLRLLKIAARVAETKSRVRLAFAAACPEADLFRGLAKTLLPRGP